MPQPPPGKRSLFHPFDRLPPILACCAAAAFARGEDLPVALTTAEAIHALPLAVAEQRPPATLRGVVTFTAFWDKASITTVQDATAGVFVEMQPPLAAPLRFGQVVEMRGHVEPGRYAPNFSAEEVRTVGVSEPPLARAAGYDELRGGRFDSQFVEVEGIVRDVQREAEVLPPSTVLTLAMPGGRAEVFLSLLPEEAFAGLVDCRVRVRGVVFSYFNARRQSFGFRIMACERGQLETTAPAPAPPFSLPPTPVGSLLQFDPRGPSPHRVRVQGVVSLHWPGDFLFLQAGGDGLLVRSRQRELLRPGDFVDVMAFPAMGAYAAQLEDACVRKLGEQAPPAPAPVPLADLVSGRAEGRLVQVEAALEGVAERAGRALLMLRSGNLLVPAELPAPISELPMLRSGSVLRVTGVCQVEVGSLRRFASVYQPESARLLLRSAEDIQVVRAAPWWTPRRLGAALGMLAAVLGVALAWASSLHRRNMRLRAEIAARERAEAEVRRSGEERRLLAADLHDSLEQSLTGVALQLRAARDAMDEEDEAADQTHLTLAERLLDHSRAEVHRAVRDLRQPSHEPLDLPAALRELARLSGAGGAACIRLDLPERLPPFPSHLGYHVLHLAQEGVTNALKHSGARCVTVALRVDAGEATVEVCDDGAGFDPANRPGPAQGHFGLQGMKERVARLNGALILDSKPGRGARIAAKLPLCS